MGLNPAHADYFKPGDWNGRCQECDEKYKFSELKMRWDGFCVCCRCFEIRHPQDFLRGIPDDMSVPYSIKTVPVYVGEPWIETPGTRLLDGSMLDTTTLG